MKMNLPSSVTFCEVGLRDGLQNDKKILTVDEKLEIINGLVDAGVKVIEVGSFVSPKAVPQMANTDEVFNKLDKNPNVEYRTLIANAKGVERAIACGCTKVKLNVSASTAHNLANLNMTPAESVAKFEECVRLAKEASIGISGSISMAFGSPWDKEISLDTVKEIIEAYLAVGVTEISLSDASGMAYPNQVYEMCVEVKKAYPQVTWWLHFHNTRGLGLANVLAGMEAGMTNFDGAFAGIGGCPFVPGAAGNISSEDVVHMWSEMGVDSGINLDKIIDVARFTSSLVNSSTNGYILRAGKSKSLIREIPTGQIKNQTLNTEKKN